MFQQFFLAEHQKRAGQRRRRAAVRRGPPGRAAAARRCRAGPGRAGPPGRARPTQLSGGERQRVAIARAIAGPPAGGAGRRADGQPGLGHRRSRILALLEELNAAGTTIIVITHDHAVAARMRRRIEVLDGHIVADTDPVAAAAATDSPCRREPHDHHHRASPARRSPRGPAAAGGPGRAGQRRAADPEAAGGAVGAGHRDRGGRDRGRPRPGPLLPGRAAGRDRQAGHQPADRHQRADLHRQTAELPKDRAGDGRSSCPA